MNERWKQYLPVIFAAVAALSRWPGLLPPNFSVMYALCFCAGVFFPGRTGWMMPAGVMLATDLALNGYYQFGMGIQVFKIGRAHV